MTNVLHFYLWFWVLLRINAKPNAVREQKSFFSIFSLVDFPNELCQTDDQLVGTCYTKWECKNLGGKERGSCASKFGVCCVFEVGCGGGVQHNNSIILSPGYPSTFTETRRCDITIKKLPNICQVRLDFVKMTLAQPSHTVCVNDQFFAPGFLNIPIICGENSGQHIYIDFTENNELPLSFVTARVSVERIWNVQVIFIGCDSTERAPGGCLQYYKQTKGYVSSFNFESTLQNIPRHLSNQNYAICVQPNPGFCHIRWTPECFEITGSDGTAMRGEQCQFDWVSIPNAYKDGGTLTFDRFCGTRLNTMKKSSESVSLISASMPFTLHFVTNTKELPKSKNRGFKLKYEQLPCVV
ncbi:uncharacterized protein LOC143226194 [Tachypleus tridentatus]|uniref:uncharacterized protein LOC143226194 n=1 Tax=Tachypleus tridentatus TaxID=6853 RepID=UPI003FCF03F7